MVQDALLLAPSRAVTTSDITASVVAIAAAEIAFALLVAATFVLGDAIAHIGDVGVDGGGEFSGVDGSCVLGRGSEGRGAGTIPLI